MLPFRFLGNYSESKSKNIDELKLEFYRKTLISAILKLAFFLLYALTQKKIVDPE